MSVARATSDLEIALGEPGCAVCRVRLAAERECMIHLGGPCRGEAPTQDDPSAWSGCCLQHLDDLLGIQDAIAGAGLALAVLQGAAMRLQARPLDAREVGSCRICACGSEVELRTLAQLGRAMAESGPLTGTYLRSDGLCLRHLLLARGSGVAGAEQLRADALSRVDQLRRKLGRLLAPSPAVAEGETWLEAHHALRRSSAQIALPSGDGRRGDRL